MANIVKRERIDCDFVRTQAYDVYYRDEDWNAAVSKVRALREAGVQSAIDLTMSSSPEEAERVSLRSIAEAARSSANQTSSPMPKAQKAACRMILVTWRLTC